MQNQLLFELSGPGTEVNSSQRTMGTGSLLNKMAPSTITKLKNAISGKETQDDSLITEVSPLR